MKVITILVLARLQIGVAYFNLVYHWLLIVIQNYCLVLCNRWQAPQGCHHKVNC